MIEKRGEVNLVTNSGVVDDQRTHPGASHPRTFSASKEQRDHTNHTETNENMGLKVPVSPRMTAFAEHFNHELSA